MPFVEWKNVYRLYLVKPSQFVKLEVHSSTKNTHFDMSGEDTPATSLKVISENKDMTTIALQRNLRE